MTLQVLVPYTNPMRWASRLANYRRCEEALLQCPGLNLTTIELANGSLPFELPAREGVTRLRYSSSSVLWHKENLAALAERQISYECAAILDGDMLFHDPQWAVQTVRALQVHPIVQVSSWLVNLGPAPHEEAMLTAPSFMQVHLNDYSAHRVEWYDNGTPQSMTRWGYPGGCWAWSKRAYHEMGGLLERCIAGSGDFHMALGLVGMTSCDPVLNNRDYTQAYRDYVGEWQRQAFAAIRGLVGLVAGTALHLWHGRSSDRQYETRPRILVRNKFDPHFDLWKRHDGLIELTDAKPRLVRDLWDYFQTRYEDSVDTEEQERRRRHHHPHPPRPPRPPPYPPCHRHLT